VIKKKCNGRQALWNRKEEETKTVTNSMGACAVRKKKNQRERNPNYTRHPKHEDIQTQKKKKKKTYNEPR